MLLIYNKNSNYVFNKLHKIILIPPKVKLPNNLRFLSLSAEGGLVRRRRIYPPKEEVPNLLRDVPKAKTYYRRP